MRGPPCWGVARMKCTQSLGRRLAETHSTRGATTVLMASVKAPSLTHTREMSEVSGTLDIKVVPQFQGVWRPRLVMHLPDKKSENAKSNTEDALQLPESSSRRPAPRSGRLPAGILSGSPVFRGPWKGNRSGRFGFRISPDLPCSPLSKVLLPRPQAQPSPRVPCGVTPPLLRAPGLGSCWLCCAAWPRCCNMSG